MSTIFISHSSKDGDLARDVEARLARAGYRSIFLDFDPEKGIAAGSNWERTLYTKLRACRAVVALCTDHYLGSHWCFAEVALARMEGKHIFALQADPWSEKTKMPSILTQDQYIDLRARAEEGFRRLRDGLKDKGIAPAEDRDWNPQDPPYPGLRSFLETDADIFFGRERETQQAVELINSLRRQGHPHLLQLLGTSGSGKSSLARAGIVPRLRRDRSQWIVVDPFRPGKRPTRELAAALSRAFEIAGKPRTWDEILARLEAEGDGSTSPLAEIAAELRLDHGPSEAAVLLVIDQFEELLGGVETRAASRAGRFLSMLAAGLATEDIALFALTTMRSEYLGAFLKTAPLRELAFKSFSLGPMTSEGMRQVIEEPARLGQIELERTLVGRLLADTGGPEALPLLAFTLRRMWERFIGPDDRLLELREYEQLGGLQGAIAQVAEESLEAALAEGSEEDLRKAFLSMARPSEEGAGWLRQSFSGDQLAAEQRQRVLPMLQHFVNQRLLVLRGEGEFEVAHESLFESWETLKGWLKDNREALELLRELRTDADKWHDSDLAEDKASYLWRGARLARALELKESRLLTLTETDEAFIAESQRTEEASARRELEQAIALADARARSARRLRSGLIAALSLAAVAVGAGAAAWVQRGKAQAEKAIAQSERQRAEATAVQAEDRARSAEIAEAKALAAQNFAEHHRVRSRAANPELEADRRTALTAIAPKFLAQSQEHQERAAQLTSEFEAWRAAAGVVPPTPEAFLSLEILPARGAGMFLLHFGPEQRRRLMLFDGGEPVNYRKTLEPRLSELDGTEEPLAIELVVSTQTDWNHIGGLHMLLKANVEAPLDSRPYSIGGLWSNAFLVADDHVARKWNKAQVITMAKELGVPINRPFSRSVTLPELGSARVEFPDDLTITILGPPTQWLRVFSDWWIKEWARRAGNGNIVLSAFSSREALVSAFPAAGLEVLETFADPRLELLPSPFEIFNPPPDVSCFDSSPANLASIVSMVELGNRRILMPADACHDVLLEALAQAGYSDSDGNTWVDVLVLPHNGSDRNVSPAFFERVKARHYVATGDGRYGNPEVRTFEWLFAARRGDQEPFSIYLTKDPKEYRDTRAGYPLDELCALMRREWQAGTPFDLMTPSEGKLSTTIDLLRPDPELDKGARNLACVE